jgi:hypothetical protein
VTCQHGRFPNAGATSELDASSPRVHVPAAGRRLGVLAAITFPACYEPSRRVARVDPYTWDQGADVACVDESRRGPT